MRLTVGRYRSCSLLNFLTPTEVLSARCIPLLKPVEKERVSAKHESFEDKVQPVLRTNVLQVVVKEQVHQESEARVEYARNG